MAVVISNQEIIRIMADYTVPDYVVEASMEQILGEHEKNASYTDFPCDTAASTIISAIRFYENDPSEQNKLTEENIKAAAVYFGINHDLQLMEQQVRAMVKLAGHTTTEKYPVRNEAEMKAACDYLFDFYTEIPFAEKSEIAVSILKQSSFLHADMHTLRGKLYKLAGLGVCTSKEAASLIQSRLNLLARMHPERDVPIQLQEVKVAVETNPLLTANSQYLVKLASLIDGIDREFAFTQYYNQGLQAPEDVLFSINEHVVTSLEDDLITNTKTGRMYKKADLLNAPTALYQLALQPATFEKLAMVGLSVEEHSLRSILPTLSYEDAQKFDYTCTEYSVYPIGQEVPVKMAVAALQDKTALSETSS